MGSAGGSRGERQVFAMKVIAHSPNATLTYGKFADRLAIRPSVWLILSVLSIPIVSGSVLVLGPSQIMGPWDVFILLEEVGGSSLVRFHTRTSIILLARLYIGW